MYIYPAMYSSLKTDIFGDLIHDALTLALSCDALYKYQFCQWTKIREEKSIYIRCILIRMV